MFIPETSLIFVGMIFISSVRFIVTLVRISCCALIVDLDCDLQLVV